LVAAPNDRDGRDRARLHAGPPRHLQLPGPAVLRAPWLCAVRDARGLSARASALLSQESAPRSPCWLSSPSATPPARSRASPSAGRVAWLPRTRVSCGRPPRPGGAADADGSTRGSLHLEGQR